MGDATYRFTIVVDPAGLTFEAAAGATVLQSAREAGLGFPSSCRNGTCRACMCRLLDGRVSYRMEWPGVSAEEKAEGFILPCVAYPESPLRIEPTRVTDLRGASRTGSGSNARHIPAHDAPQG